MAEEQQQRRDGEAAQRARAAEERRVAAASRAAARRSKAEEEAEPGAKPKTVRQGPGSEAEFSGASHQRIGERLLHRVCYKSPVLICMGEAAEQSFVALEHVSGPSGWMGRGGGSGGAVQPCTTREPHAASARKGWILDTI